MQYLFPISFNTKISIFKIRLALYAKRTQHGFINHTAFLPLYGVVAYNTTTVVSILL
jgi:hypothetical protein